MNALPVELFRALDAFPDIAPDERPVVAPVQRFSPERGTEQHQRPDEPQRVLDERQHLARQKAIPLQPHQFHGDDGDGKPRERSPGGRCPLRGVAVGGQAADQPGNQGSAGVRVLP
jgi:hypothetical protein